MTKCSEDFLSADVLFMQEALKEARKALAKEEVPVGAVIVCENKIIGRGYNLTQTLKDTTAHAEMQAFTAATEFLGGKYLNGCTLYVTLEPCIMCAGASYWTQISRIVYGAKDEKRGYSKISERILHPKTQITEGILNIECAQLLIDFFKHKRK